MTAGRFTGLAALAAFVVLACTSPSPTRPPPTRTPEETDTPRPIVIVSPSPSPTLAVNPSLRVDGMATVHLDGISQVVDPAHPNHDRDLNAELGTLSAGEHVFLVGQGRVKRDSYWQIARDTTGATGPLGWIPQLRDGELTLDPFQPECPTAFPLTAADLTELGSLEALSCFGNTELTLTGTVSCNRSIGEPAITGATFLLDPNRSCSVDDYAVHGRAITSLLDEPTPVETVYGRYLVRGHFDDSDAQFCYSIPFGTPPGGPGSQPAELEAVLSCRQMFVVSTVTPLD